jgi:hypothetical protein
MEVTTKTEATTTIAATLKGLADPELLVKVGAPVAGAAVVTANVEGATGA